jgi:hypothetical protein
MVNQAQNAYFRPQTGFFIALQAFLLYYFHRCGLSRPSRSRLPDLRLSPFSQQLPNLVKVVKPSEMLVFRDVFHPKVPFLLRIR